MRFLLTFFLTFAPMKRFFLHIIIFISASLWLESCKEKENLPTPDEGISIQDSTEFTAILYMLAEGLGDYWTEQDIKELVSGKDQIPENARVVIYIDYAKDKYGQDRPPVIYQVDAKHGKRVWMTYENDEDCTDSLTMLRNLKHITTYFPARKYGITFSAHGSGWTFRHKAKRRAIGWDNTYGTNYLNIPTLRGVLENLPRMEYVFFDVCFMQCVEVAYELRNTTRWVIGSPAEIPLKGAPYDLLARPLTEGDVEGIVRNYEGYFTKDGYLGVLLSAARCDKLDTLAIATSAYVKEHFADKGTLANTSGIQRYSDDFSFTYCYDIRSLMYNMLSESEYLDWMEVYEMAVPIRAIGTGRWMADFCSSPYPYVRYPEQYGGMSMFIPEYTSQMTQDLHLLQWYTGAGWATTGW